MVDLEVVTLVAAGDHAGMVAGFERRPEAGRDRPTEVGYRPDVGSVVKNRLHDPILGQPACGRDRHGSEACHATRLTGQCATALPGRLIDVDMHDGTGSRCTSGEANKRVGRVRLAALRTPGTPRPIEERAGPLFEDGEQARSCIRGQTGVEPDGTIRVGPVTEVSAAVEAFVVIVVALGGSDHFATTFSETSHGFDLSRVEQFRFRSRVGGGRRCDLLSLVSRQRAGYESLAGRRQLLELAAGLKRRDRRSHRALRADGHPLRGRAETLITPELCTFDHSSAERPPRIGDALELGESLDQVRGFAWIDGVKTLDRRSRQCDRFADVIVQHTATLTLAYDNNASVQRKSNRMIATALSRSISSPAIRSA